MVYRALAYKGLRTMTRHANDGIQQVLSDVTQMVEQLRLWQVVSRKQGSEWTGDIASTYMGYGIVGI